MAQKFTGLSFSFLCARLPWDGRVLIPGGLRGGVEDGRDGDLGLEAGRDVHLLDGHEGLVEVVLHRDLEPLGGVVVVRVVVRLRVQQKGQTVRLANLCEIVQNEESIVLSTRTM